MVSLNAGLRASGNVSQAMIVPARVSTLRKSSNAISAMEMIFQDIQRRLRALGQVIELEDMSRAKPAVDDVRADMASSASK